MNASFEQMLSDLCDGLKSHSQAIVVAPPGTGKTTRIPPRLIEQDWAQAGQVVVLEPRRVAARASADFIARSRGEKTGKVVGYELRLDRKISQATRINFQTEGLFLRRLIADPELDGVTAVVFDEFHERSLNADLCLALCLEIQGALRPDLKIIIMSATLDIEPIQRVLKTALRVQCDAVLHPIETRYLGKDRDTPTGIRVAQAIARAMNQDEGSILAFLPGQREINRCFDSLREMKLDDQADIYPLHGQLDARTQDEAIAPVGEGVRRKVVLSTAIAQTSLTIEGVHIVIDSGLSRNACYDPRSGLNRLVTEKVTRSSADQRRGRSGRTGPGICYRLWDEEQNRALIPFDEPEICSADLTSLALILADWGVQNYETINWIDVPPKAAMDQAYDLLEQLEAVDQKRNITNMGRAMVKMPLHPRLSHMILKAVDRGEGKRAAYLAAMLSEQGIGGKNVDLEARFEQFVRDASRRSKALKAQAMHWLDGRVPKQETGKLSLGALLSLGFPDRVARARSSRPGYYTLANGSGAHVDAHDALAKQDFLAIFELSGAKQDARIFSAAAILKSEIESLFSKQIKTEMTISFDAQSQSLRAMRGRRLGALILAQDPSAVPRGQGAEILLEAVKEAGLAILPWGKSTLAWLERLRFLSREGDVELPDFQEEALLNSMDIWLRPLLEDVQGLGQIKAEQLDAALKNRLDWSQNKHIETAAPSHFTAPTGAKHPIDYSAEAGPIVSLRLQELFGLGEHPRLGPKQWPLRLALLSPAHRPIQITQDLPGFWRGSYAQVRSEMRGRYPKHFWPENPLDAEPTRRAKRRGG
ncbi:MAG: ATP-dependent helicase HrpB [Sphingomonadales bacterium]|jgi:ATP-dependent helicase HrpB